MKCNYVVWGKIAVPFIPREEVAYFLKCYPVYGTKDLTQFAGGNRVGEEDERSRNVCKPRDNYTFTAGLLDNVDISMCILAHVHPHVNVNYSESHCIKARQCKSCPIFLWNETPSAFNFQFKKIYIYVSVKTFSFVGNVNVWPEDVHDFYCWFSSRCRLRMKVSANPCGLSLSKPLKWNDAQSNLP